MHDKEYSFDDALESANKQYGGSSGGFYTIEEGNKNVLRVLTPGAEYATQFMGVKNYRTLYGKEKGDPLRQPSDPDANRPGRILAPLDDKGKESKASIKSMLYVLDRVTDKIVLADFPYSITKQIGALQKNPDYAFKILPMPYDIRITYAPKAAPNEKYRVEVKPTGEPLTQEQLAELQSKVAQRSPESVAEGKKNAQREDDMRNGRIISEDELEATKKDYNSNMMQTMKEQRVGMSDNEVSGIEYPEDEINPADIPF